MKEHYYLDNAATTWPKPEAVYLAMDRLYRQCGVNPGRAGHELALEAEMLVGETRRLLAAFFGFAGDAQRVVFTQNATDSLNLALYGLLGERDHVVTTRLEHNSVLRPLNHLQRDRQVQVTHVGRDAKGYVDPAEIRRAITPRTRLVVVNHASNVLGSVQDLAAIGRITREAGVLLVLDTCQSAGVLAIDMDALGVDLLAFTGHKGLYGPMGIGGLIVRDGVAVRPVRVGGTGTDSISPYQPEQYPWHLEAGTVSMPGVAGLNAAQKWFAALGREQLADPDAGHASACRAALAHIEAHELRLIERLETALRDIPGVTVHGPARGDPRVATLSISIAGMPADQAGAMLDADWQVCVRAGLHCAPLVHEDAGTLAHNGTVRFAPAYLNEEADIDRAIAGVADLSS